MTKTDDETELKMKRPLSCWRLGVTNPYKRVTVRKHQTYQYYGMAFNIRLQAKTRGDLAAALYTPRRSRKET